MTMMTVTMTELAQVSVREGVATGICPECEQPVFVGERDGQLVVGYHAHGDMVCPGYEMPPMLAVTPADGVQMVGEGWRVAAGVNVYVATLEDALAREAVPATTPVPVVFTEAELVCCPFDVYDWRRSGISTTEGGALAYWAQDGYFGFRNGQRVFFVHKAAIVPVIDLPDRGLITNAGEVDCVEYVGNGLFTGYVGWTRVHTSALLFSSAHLRAMLADGALLTQELATIRWQKGTIQ